MRILIFILFVVVAHADDWPCWRGAKGDGIASVSDDAITWPANGPKENWRIPLGEGYAGLSVYNNTIYTLYSDTKFEYCVALSCGDGRELWRHKIDYIIRRGSERGPQSTPCVFDGRVYAISSHGELWCLDAQSGEKIWHYNILVKFHGDKKPWGTSASPLIYDGKLFFHIANRAFVAVSVTDGEVLWSTYEYEEEGSYSTPVIAHGENAYVIFFTGSSCLGISPKNGDILWRYPWETSGGNNAATPIFFDNYAFFSASYGRGSLMLKIDPQQNYHVEKIWASNIRNHFSTSIRWKQHFYGFHTNRFVCFNAATGKIEWKERGFGKGMIAGMSNGYAIMISEKGKLSLFELNSKKFVHKGTCFPFPSTTCRTVPTIANGFIYLRNREEVVCLNLRGNQ